MGSISNIWSTLVPLAKSELLVSCLTFVVLRFFYLNIRKQAVATQNSIAVASVRVLSAVWSESLARPDAYTQSLHLGVFGDFL